jgi:23S rRNA (guanosine2251-2'-O)-methyltransferase
VTRERSASTVAGRRAVTEAIRSGAASEVLLARGVRDTPGLRAVREAASMNGTPVLVVERRELDGLAADHPGVVAGVGPARPPLGERDLAVHRFQDDDFVVVLDGITDPQNLGACARSAEAAGATMLVTRTRRAADVTPAAIRASAGALLHLPHARVANVARALGRLQEAGFFVVGLEERAEGSVYDAACPLGLMALVVGAEGKGMSRLVRDRCDALVRLPMTGRVGSLNASASLAAALWSYVVPSRPAGRSRTEEGRTTEGRA